MGGSEGKTHSRTLPSVFCGERALQLLPEPGEWQRGEVLLRGEPLTRIDAWGGATLRCLIEYLARYRQGRTNLWPCEDEAAWTHLHALVGEDCPAHLILTQDAIEASGEAPPEVLLPALPIQSENNALELAERLLAACEAIPAQGRFVAKYLPVLVVNSLKHADSPVPPVACAYHDRANKLLQLVVVDLGRRNAPYTQKTLLKQLESSPYRSLKTLVGDAKERKLDIYLDVVAGSGHVQWRNGFRRMGTGPKIFGFCSAITVPL